MKEIIELDYGECRFIVADEPVRLYCAEPVVGASSWCPEHYQICFMKSSREPTRKALAPAEIVAPPVLKTAAPVTLVLRWPS